MYRRKYPVLVLAVAFLVGSTPAHDASAQQPTALSNGAFQVTAPGDLQWTPDPEFPDLDHVVLHGALRFSEPYVYRLRARAPAHIPLHAHERTEYITVIQGTLRYAVRQGTDSSTRTCGPGCFLLIPSGHSHQAWLETGTVLQIHGVGPSEILGAPPSSSAN